MAAKKDPRTQRTKAHNLAAEKIAGIAGIFREMPDTRFQLVDFDLFTEDEAKNDLRAIIHVFKWAKVGSRWVLLPARVRCYLAWPVDSTGNPDSLEQWQLPGNLAEPYQHMIYSDYAPPKKGPLAVFIGDDSGQVDSDIAGGIGLPNKRHIGVHMTFVERWERRQA